MPHGKLVWFLAHQELKISTCFSLAEPEEQNNREMKNKQTKKGKSRAREKKKTIQNQTQTTQA